MLFRLLRLYGMMRIIMQMQTVMPTEKDSIAARESGRQLAPYLQPDHDLRVQVMDDANTREVVSIPRAALKLLVEILAVMAEGNAVTVLPTTAELTTQQAADILNVSRPYLVQLLETNALPCRMVGTHRRVALTDLLHYKQQSDAARREALTELAAQAQEFGMGY